MAESGMNKRHQQQQKPQPTEKPAASQRPAQPAPIDVPRNAANQKIEPERFCPICWGARKGYGTTQRTDANGKRYYRCCQCLDANGSPCGWTWTMTPAQVEDARRRYEQQLSAIVVQHQEVRIDGTR